MSVLTQLWILVLLSLCCAVRSLPCPVPEDVFPCVCTSDEEHNMDMDCSQVESEDQLRQVFSAYLPFPEFRELKILNNEHLKVLREGDLGLASFRYINIVRSALAEVEPGALAQSASTLIEIRIQGNLTKFPFEELPSWTSLAGLLLISNSFNLFPVLVSDSLHYFDISNNFISDIPADALKAVPKLRKIHVSTNKLKKLTQGLFSTLNDLSSVSFGYNKLTHITNGDLPLTESDKGEISLQNNNISSIAVGGITGLTNGRLFLFGNALTSLPEDVFRPILEGGSTLYLVGNPLGCGCDIAWLITNSYFMSLIGDTASCYDGTHLSDLDPSIYEDLC